ncbi:MAG: zinc-binding alcohol dehydrogenase family protein [Methylophaga sp.]|nr:zinc-binding alcohol dehydrogenase family protein [Methylophaga sp.]
MQAFAFYNAQHSPERIEIPTPIPHGHDLLVAIEAIAVNPVDTKVRASLGDQQESPRIIGWDACGSVVAAGPACQHFKAGDRVFYAGDISRPGCYASHQLVDERIVGPAPQSISPEQSAAIPLTAITAWESLFSRLKIHPETDQGKRLLIIGGAGGVGSIAIQIAKVMAGLEVIATASRPESEAWCRQMGADHIIRHGDHLINDYQALNIAAPDYILCLNETDHYFAMMCELIAPQGLICLTVTNQRALMLEPLKNKSAGVVWEFMFTRPMMKTDDITTQQDILTQVSAALDQGQLKPTMTTHLGAMTVDTIERAHKQLLSGRTIGKIALSSMSD